MSYLTDICFMCLKNSIKLQSVFIEDNDGIIFNEKLRCCFPEKINSTPDAHKLACSECLEKLRYLYGFKQSAIRNNTVVNNYLDKLQYENKTHQQPSVVLATRKRQRNVSPTDNFSEIKVENAANSSKLKIKNPNLNSTNEELKTVDNSFHQPTANENIAFLTEYKCINEKKDLETKNMEKVATVTETGTICVKQESQFLKLNLTSSNAEQLNTVDHSFQTTFNGNVLLTKYNCLTEEKNLETKNVEKVIPVTETETIYIKQESQFSDDDTTTNFLDKEVKHSKDTEIIYIKQEPQFFEDESTTSYLDKEAKDSEGSNSSNKVNFNFEMSEEKTSRANNYNKQNFYAINTALNSWYVSDDSAKFCNTCQDLLFEDLNNINMHLHTHIQSSNCSRCEDSLEDIYKFQRHIFNHCKTIFEMLDKGDHGEKFSCALCDQQFDKFSNLRNHISDEHIRSLKCVVCSKNFTYKPNLLRHILMTHCHVKLYKCKICPTRFVSKEGIKDHMIYRHYSGKVCICKFCQQTFRNPKALREHISRCHEEDLRIEEDDSLKKDYTCDRLSCAVCQKQFNDLDNLKKHLYNNHVSTLDCEICSKSFSRRSGTFRHILETHCRVKIYNCIICTKKFTFKQSFEQHMISEHNNSNSRTETKPENKLIVTENVKKISCGICSTLYDDYKRFKKHIYSEHMPSLECVICSGSYRRRDALHRHILEQHCDVKLLKCVICSSQFTDKESYKNHMIHQHNGGNTITEPESNVFPVIILNKEKLSCAVCKKQLDSFESLKRHIYDDHITGLNCVVCSKTCSRREYLNRHILEQHCHLKLINCKLCPQRFGCKESFKDHMIQQHSSGKISAVTDVDKKIGAVTELDNKTGAVTKLDNKVGAVTELDNKLSAITELDNKFGAVTNLDNKVDAITELDNKVGVVTNLDNKVGAVTELDNKLSAITELDNKFGAVTNLDNKVGVVTNLDNKVGAITELDNKVGAVTELDNKLSAITELDNKFGAVTNLDNKVGVVTNLDNKVGVVTNLDNKVGAITELENKLSAITELDNKFGAVTNLDNKVGVVINLDNKVGVVTNLDNKVGAVTELDNKLSAITELDNKFGAVTNLDNKVGVVTNLDNKVGAITELDYKVGAVIKPEEVFIKDEPHYSDEYCYSDEEFEADNNEIGKKFSNFAMAEESNSRTSNSSYFQESVGSSVIPNTTATTNASYCEPGAPVDQSDVCDICHKMFLYLSNLSEHLNTHMQDSSCSMCKDSAENISRLQRHMLTPCGNTNTPPDSANTANR